MNSVCITTYNGERYVAEQLRSILEQIGAEDEVIVSDDGSTDGTLKVIESMNDPRIRIIHCTAHSYIDNFIHAMRQAQGEIVFLSDQDDVWLPGKYEHCLKELETADLVCTDCKMTDENLEVTAPSYFAFRHSGPGIWKNIWDVTYCGACMAFRRTLLDSAFPFPPTQNIGHDLWLGLVGEMTGKVTFMDTPYLLYRRHADCLTRDGNIFTRSKRPLWQKVWSRVEMLYYVCKFKVSHGK